MECNQFSIFSIAVVVILLKFAMQYRHIVSYSIVKHHKNCTPTQPVYKIGKIAFSGDGFVGVFFSAI